MRNNKSVFITVLVLLLASKAHCQETLLDTLSVYVSEFTLAAQKENASLWGESFEVPVMIKTPAFFVTNKPVEGFVAYKNLFYGTIDDIKSGGNSWIRWRDVDWAFYTYSAARFKDKSERLELFFHEAFHRNQPSLHLSGVWTQCKHLNEYEARCLLRLECNALLHALDDSLATQSLLDALTFRAYRYALYPNAYLEEAQMEMLEGVAYYTGIKLSGRDFESIKSKLKTNMSFNQQFFAYSSGGLYCFVLDKLDSTWRKELKQNDNFLYFAQKQLGLQLPNTLKSATETIRQKYDWNSISASEKALAKKTKQQEKLYTEMFLNKTVLKLNREQCKRFTIQSSIVFPLANGKVYNAFSTWGDWGVLTSKDEIFWDNDVILATPFEVQDKKILGKGWEIVLNDGWTVKKTSKQYFELVEAAK